MEGRVREQRQVWKANYGGPNVRPLLFSVGTDPDAVTAERGPCLIA